MKKYEIINILELQKTTVKSTRKKVIEMIINLLDSKIADNLEIDGLSINRSSNGLNLGDIMEVITKYTILQAYGITTNELIKDLTKQVQEIDKDNTPKKLRKDGQPYINGVLDHTKAVYKTVVKHDHMNRQGDLIINGESFEIKFSTSDAYATGLKDTKADNIIVVSWTASDGLNVFKCKPNEVVLHKNGRVVPNQKMKYLDRNITNLLGYQIKQGLGYLKDL